VDSPRIPLFQRGGHPLHPLTRVPKGLVTELIRDYLAALDSPRAISVWLLLESGTEEDLLQLVTLTCNPDDYARWDQFQAAFAATKLLSKCVDLKTGIDLPGVAVESAYKAEKSCRTTNEAFRSYRTGAARHPLEVHIPWIREKIRRILGPVPEKLSFVGWSKGRTTSAFGSDLSLTKKYGARPDITGSALRHALRVVRDSPVWGAALLQCGAPVSVVSKDAFDVVQGNVMITVPKNAKTERVICYEPHMNIALQLAAGDVMRQRLRRHGVNLDDQSINQRRSMLGSKYGNLATLDLRSASDTVAREVVEELLPIEWVCLLDDLRSKYTTWPDGLTLKNEKFSSMGNGFTFELESLLFYAICSAVARDVSVYGDDIILPTENFDEAVKLLEFFGFEINPLKSFSHGNFRESCGENGFCGLSVTPVYLSSFPKTVDDVLKFHNRVTALVQRCQLPSQRWQAWLRKLRRRVPCLLGPQGYGDGHYHVDSGDARPKRAANWVEGFWYTTFLREYRKGCGSSVDGEHFQSDLGYAAICASVGPQRPRWGGMWSSAFDRRYFRYKKARALTSICWPEINWAP